VSLASTSSLNWHAAQSGHLGAAALRHGSGIAFQARDNRRQGTTMLSITAVIRAKAGHEGALRDALLVVAENVRLNEPETIGFFISQDSEDPCVFTTYERFADGAAMDRHNNSAVVAKFFGIAQPILDGEVTLVTSVEISAKA
jgi:quinol monooxygenase YgiN